MCSVVSEAKLEKTERRALAERRRLVRLNMRDAEWRHADGRGAVCIVGDDFEGWRQPARRQSVRADARRADVDVPLGGEQEGFLVVSGEALLIVESEERPLGLGFLPRSREHAARDRRGGRRAGSRDRGRRRLHSEDPTRWDSPDEVAGAIVRASRRTTMDGGVAYAALPGRRPTTYREGWLPD